MHVDNGTFLCGTLSVEPLVGDLGSFFLLVVHITLWSSNNIKEKNALLTSLVKPQARHHHFLDEQTRQSFIILFSLHLTKKRIDLFS